MKLSEDHRRLLIDWNDDIDIKTCKIVKAKEDCLLGDHYHKEKTERFMLIQGSAKYSLDSSEMQQMIPFKPVIVKPNVLHSFYLTQGSVLACLVDKLYNENDDFRIEEDGSRTTTKI